MLYDLGIEVEPDTHTRPHNRIGMRAPQRSLSATETIAIVTEGFTINNEGGR